MAQFLYILLIAAKKLVTAWAKYLSVSERSYWVISENGLVNRFWSYYFLETEDRDIYKKMLSQQENPVSCILRGWYLANGSSGPNNP